MYVPQDFKSLANFFIEIAFILTNFIFFHHNKHFLSKVLKFLEKCDTIIML